MTSGFFGPSKDEIWRQLAAEIEAEHVKGGFWKRDKVQARHGEWTITLDIHVVSTGKSTHPFTRLRAPYVNSSGFRFTIYRKGFFSELAKRLGMQDVEVGHREFDRDFVIKGNDEGKLRALFANERLRELIAAQPEIHLSVQDDEGFFGAEFPEDTDELCFQVHGILKDLERLKQLFDLLAETLDQLAAIGAAQRRPPQVKL